MKAFRYTVSAEISTVILADNAEEAENQFNHQAERFGGAWVKDFTIHDQEQNETGTNQNE
jgi:hypothetical protein